MVYEARIHMYHHGEGHYSHALCKRVTDLVTREPQAVTCQACINLMELNPA